jgi:hypothetical protein
MLMRARERERDEALRRFAKLNARTHFFQNTTSLTLTPPHCCAPARAPHLAYHPGRLHLHVISMAAIILHFLVALSVLLNLQNRLSLSERASEHLTADKIQSY